MHNYGYGKVEHVCEAMEGIVLVGIAIIVARKSSSPAVKAEGVHYALEGFISMAIACAFMVTIRLKQSQYSYIEPYIDPIITILVSIFISVPSIKLTKQAFVNLLDISIEEPSKMGIVARLAQYVDYFCNFQDIKTRTPDIKNL